MKFGEVNQFTVCRCRIRSKRDRRAGGRRQDPQLTADGVVSPNTARTREDAIILATGYKPALSHLHELGFGEPNGTILVRGARSVGEPMLWLVGYGDWTGYASATLIGVGHTARATAEEIDRALRGGGETE